MLTGMKIRSLVAVLCLAGMTLVGCSPASEPDPATTSTPSAVAADEATPEQVASVLAEYEPDWREVIDGAFDCRTTWTLDSSVTGQLEGMSCYLREQTMGMTAQIVLRDWSALEIPQEMQGLVDRTSESLQVIADNDIKAVCGEDSLPAATNECSEALGNRSMAYTLLEGKLDAWKPYL